jgi:flagellar hook-basal body complex protein FliE
MVDKIANPAAAANAYATMAKTAGIGNVGTGAEDKLSFGDLLKNAAVESIKTMRGGETASARAVTGEASLPEVVQAVTAAELTLQTVVAVRDRVVSAYQEVMRMPI